MGYARMVQFADVVEYYNYEKQYVQPRRKNLSRIQKKRKLIRGNLHTQKTEFSIRNAKKQFFRIVSEAIYTRGRPCLLTLTLHRDDVQLNKAYTFIRQFKDNVKNKMGAIISYIAVPEYQKTGRIHFHILAWGLPEEWEKTERDTRNLQRLYGRGFLDVRFAYDSSPKLASYLTKYMSKSYTDNRNIGRKAYTTSRSIVKPRTYGSNTLSTYTNELLPSGACIDKIFEYNTQYLGKCLLTKYKIKKNDKSN